MIEDIMKDVSNIALTIVISKVNLIGANRGGDSDTRTGSSAQVLQWPSYSTGIQPFTLFLED